MTTFRKAFLAAIVKSLLRGKSLIQAILSFWVTPLAVDTTTTTKTRVAKKALKPLQDFLKDAEASLLGPVSGDGLLDLSAGLKKQFYQRLLADPECMLPSYSHQLPTGNEAGQYVALDVGGSTLRVALVELRGVAAGPGRHSEIVSIQNFRIDKSIKDLEGMAFFDWMAVRIAETLATGLKREHSPEHPLPLALAWSFPIEQTSLAGGTLQAMGKGFLANKGLLGQDLGGIVKLACKKQGLNVELQAIINDSSACLLSQAYSHTATRFGLILGTGFNVAAYLPVSTIGKFKFGVRPDGWFDEASHVIVNTEMGMFGHNILPLTRWDLQLLESHPRPDFQPLEHMVSGMYLGEIGRLALVDAIESTGIFGGIVPSSLKPTYSLGSDTLSIVESDTSSDLAEARKVFAVRHPSSHTPTREDLAALRSLASFISVRASALVASCVFTLWDLRLESQEAFAATLPKASPKREEAEADLKLGATTVSFNGSVIENYPGFRNSCQRYIDQLVQSKGNANLGAVELVPAKESSLLGAAVALACVEGESS